MKLLTLATLLLASTFASATKEMTYSDFNEFKSSGTNGMVKFFQTWCGHCTRMKPDWDRLAEESPADVVIADVDCGKEEDLCSEVGVTGYPTIKYYVDGEETDFQGGRSFDDLSTFVSEELAAQCTFDMPDLCSDKAKKYIEKWSAKSADEKKTEVERLDKMSTGTMKADLKKWLLERKKILKSGIDGDAKEL